MAWHLGLSRKGQRRLACGVSHRIFQPGRFAGRAGSLPARNRRHPPRARGRASLHLVKPARHPCGECATTRCGQRVEVQQLGHLPISECYFAGEVHEGFSGGSIVVLHVPTNDVWVLSPFGAGSRSLCLSRIINGQKIPNQWAQQVEDLRNEALRRCGGLSPVRLDSEIFPTDVSEQWAEAAGWMKRLSTQRRQSTSATP